MDPLSSMMGSVPSITSNPSASASSKAESFMSNTNEALFGTVYYNQKDKDSNLLLILGVLGAIWLLTRKH